MTVQNDEILEHIAGTRDQMVDFLAEIVSKKSVTGHERPAQEVVKRKLKSLGLESDVWEPDPDDLRGHPGYFETSSFQKYGYEGRPNVAAIANGSGNGRSLAFSGHIDVVSVEPVSAWTRDPWGAEVEDSRMYGRGTADMKGGVAAFIHAFESLQELGVELAGDLILQTTIEEEDGGVGGLLSTLERGYQPDAAIITEPWMIPNVGIASAGVMYFRITVPGKSAHAARGYKGVNAIGKAYKIYEALDALDQERKARISYEPVLNRDPDAEGNVTNLNVGIINAGDWPSTVPGQAVMECRIGWPPGETRDEVRDQIETAIQNVIRADDWLSSNPPRLEWFGWSADPHELNQDAEIVQLARTKAEAVTNRTGKFIGGDAGLDERFYNLYYDIPCPTLGPKGDNLHGADEYVELDSIVETAQALALIAIDWCGTSE
ncbi:ArgE/DapE family deacylase [Haladaptatus halobius]|uniref:ArgE/DapE family deacylase n=1 Tax=Haladaptatus halobius TaxID=2884875 RepID=UPI001D0B4F18|nr:ArgE/DapE family deacylase [Haladaptatus halobius]